MLDIIVNQFELIANDRYTLTLLLASPLVLGSASQIELHFRRVNPSSSALRALV